MLPRGPMALVLAGTVVTFDPERPTIEDGRVYVADPPPEVEGEERPLRDAQIEAVQGAEEPEPPGYEAAPRVRTEGVIYPGLIDLHSHLAYNWRSLWFPPRAEPYLDRDQWPRAATYSQDISKPTAALSTAAAKAVLKFAEVKALVGGTTAIQGSPGLSRPYEGWLVRNIEHESFGTGEDFVFQSVINQDVEGLKPYAEKMREGRTFIYHLAEGTDPELVEELRDVEAAGGLQKTLIAIHATALGSSEFGRMGRAGASIVWSPFSNLFLYRDTTDVVAAHEEGVRVCLGSDWGPSGSRNLLGELKVADLWNRTHLDSAFSDEELCHMATAWGGDALGLTWGDRIGRIRPGLLADLLVTAKVHDDPYRNLIEATERHVRLVTVGGRPVFGNLALLEAAGVRGVEPITVAGVARGIRMVEPVKDADMTWRQVLASLEEARRNPARAFQRALAATPRGEEPLRLYPDMPGGELAAEIRSVEDLGPVVIPPIDALSHDAAFLRNLAPDRAPILGGLLDGLKDYYD
jgi:5-methylthioadenosine/S-adenosylhomocysteine deaminase